MNMKDTFFAIIGLAIGLGLTALSYPHVKPVIDKTSHEMAQKYMQPFVDKYVNGK